MKTIYLTILLLTTVGLLPARDHSHWSPLENVDIDLEDQVVVITSVDDPDQVVRISAGLELLIGDQPVNTNRRQQKLIKVYYLTVLAMHKLGARMGIEGAKVGAQARAAVYNALLQVADSFSRRPHYYADYRFDTGPPVENLGAALTEMGVAIEELAHELEATHIRLKWSVPALQRLGWF